MNLALFDLDGTLLETDSDHAFGEFLVSIGWADAQAFRTANDHFYRQYQAGVLDIDAYIAFATQPLRGRSLDERASVSRRFIETVIRPGLHPGALALVDRHRQAGDLLVIVTATNQFITRPIADLFGVQHLIATELEVDAADAFTGRICGQASYREGKIARVEQWLADQGRTWSGFERTIFYSDSTNDLPLLERVSHPVATNPSPALAAVARERGWHTLALFEPRVHEPSA